MSAFFCFYIFQTPLIIYLFHFVVDYAELVFMVSTKSLFLLFVFPVFLHHWTVLKRQVVATIQNAIYYAIFSDIFQLVVNSKQKGVLSKNMSYLITRCWICNDRTTVFVFLCKLHTCKLTQIIIWVIITSPDSRWNHSSGSLSVNPDL